MKRPRVGERVRTAGGTEVTIMGYYLYQPGAPRFFQIDVEGGTVLFVTFRGLGWVEHQAKEISNLKTLIVSTIRKQRAPANLPAETLDECASGRSEGRELMAPRQNSRLAPAKKTTERAGSNPASSTPLSSAEDNRPPISPDANRASDQMGIKKDQGRANQLSKPLAGNQGITVTPTSGETLNRRHVPAAQFISKVDSPRPSRRLRDLHARLDRARDAFGAARANLENVSGERFLELQAEYCGLVAELDAADPRHYGPVDRDEPVLFGAVELQTGCRADEVLTDFEMRHRAEQRERWHAQRLNHPEAA